MISDRENEHCIKDYPNGTGKCCTLMLHIKTVNPNIKLTFLLSADFDECSSSPCHTNASCQNSVGSYVCECIDGFTGNGSVCEGESIFW